MSYDVKDYMIEGLLGNIEDLVECKKITYNDAINLANNLLNLDSSDNNSLDDRIQDWVNYIQSQNVNKNVFDFDNAIGV